MNNTTNSWEEKAEYYVKEIVLAAKMWGNRELSDKYTAKDVDKAKQRVNEKVEDLFTLLHDTEIAAREKNEKEIKNAKKERLEECIAIINGRWNAQSEMKNDILTALTKELTNE